MRSAQQMHPSPSSSPDLNVTLNVNTANAVGSPTIDDNVRSEAEPTSETRIRAPRGAPASDELLGSEVTFAMAMGDALADILRFERVQASDAPLVIAVVAVTAGSDASQPGANVIESKTAS